MKKIVKRIEKETEKAVLVSSFWLPKSQVVIKVNHIEVPDWIFVSKGMDVSTITYTMGDKSYIVTYKDSKFESAIYLNDGNVVASFTEEENKEQIDSFSTMEGIVKETSGVELVKSYNKSAILKRAWQIAREGQAKFGGKVREYLSKSMRMAWSEVK